METGIHIGNNVEKYVVDDLGKIITQIFQAGHDCHMDQATVVEALRIIPQTFAPVGTTITGCHVDGGSSK